MSTQTIPARADVPLQYTWDAASVFANDDAWEAAMQGVTAQLETLRSYQGRLSEGPDILLAFLKLHHEVLGMVGKVYVYAGLFFTTDTSDQTAVAKMDRVRGFVGQVYSSVAFFEPELLAIGFDTLDAWVADEEGLQPYRQFVDQLRRQQAHIRSAEVEEVLSLTRDAFSTANDIHKTLTDTDFVFEPATSPDLDEPMELGQGTYDACITHPDREIRRTAWETYTDKHLAYKNTMASCVATTVKQHAFLARVRRHNSAMEAALSDNFIPPEVFHNLIETYKKNLPTWHRYWGLRRRALGLDKLREFDVKAPLTSKPPKVPFAQAVDWICDGMQPLGDVYVAPMRRGVLEQRWVDVYPNKGKRAGAFSTGVPGTHPFILMSYTDDLFSLSTLAHELGHSMHSYLTWANQPFPYARYSIFVAEVASNFNQALVRAHLFDTVDDVDFQIALIEEAMSNFHRYFFIMPALARFEFEIHRRVEAGQALTADSMIELMADLFSEAYGDEVDVDRDRTGITWATFSTHMYLDFYVYQYATGISGAHALADRVLGGEPGAVEAYLGFLGAGSSGYPLDVLKAAGVDMTTPEPVEKTFAVLAGLVDRLEGLLDQRQAELS